MHVETFVYISHHFWFAEKYVIILGHAHVVSLLDSLANGGAELLANNVPDVTSPVFDNEKYDLERLLQKKVHKGRTQYLVQWKGDYPSSWQPSENIPLHIRKSFLKSLKN